MPVWANPPAGPKLMFNGYENLEKRQPEMRELTGLARLGGVDVRALHEELSVNLEGPFAEKTVRVGFAMNNTKRAAPLLAKLDDAGPAWRAESGQEMVVDAGGCRRMVGYAPTRLR